MNYPPAAQVLADLAPQCDFFAGIDSDGCVFDVMELKHKECYIPFLIKHWNLQPISKFARETWEFVNLYSRWRGLNRWLALVKTFDLLRERPAVKKRSVDIPPVPRLREFIADDAYSKSDSGLCAYKTAHPEPELETAYAWTTEANAFVGEIVHGIPPFPYVRASLELLASQADLIVVSGTQTAAVKREWEENDIARYMRVLAGQEMGSKSVHLKLATSGKYAPNHVLMVGDAWGDWQAAYANGALFYPINPKHEDASWQRFYEEAVQKFLNGEYAGAYQAALIAQFEARLPDVPPWED
jgi:hypothetical protein